MGADRWSAKQREVIDSRNEDLLVSAAAGAGKTSVLVERILKLITEGGQDVDRFLVVTFTRDAAANMREKLSDGLERLILENPDDRRLQRQQLLLRNAAITTIDSFCNSVVHEFFHETDIDPSFRIAETAELKLLKKDVMNGLLEECYASEDAAFIRMIESYTSSKNDTAIEELITKLAEAADAQAWPEDWLDRLEAEFVAESSGNACFRQEWKDFVEEYVKARIGDSLPGMKRALDMCRMDNGPAPYAEAVTDDITLARRLTEASDYDAIAEIFASWDGPSKLNRCTACDNDLKERVKAARDDFKKLVGKIRDRFFPASQEELLRDMSAAAEPTVTLIRTTKEYMRRLTEAKKDRNMLDFGDVEHYTLRILSDRDSEGRIVPSHAARELHDRFTDIFVDEYQDSNFIQEDIIGMIAQAPGERPYTFMVGDVKQSIYRFRMAKPELFMRRARKYAKSGPGSGSRLISLGQNYRSRPEVLDSTNDVFEAAMRREVGGIDYDADARLVCGLREASSDGMPVMKENITEVILLNDNEDDESGSGAQARMQQEAAAVAVKIKELIASGLVIDPGTEKAHPVGFGDIVVLLRTMKGWGSCYCRELENAGIPVFSSAGGGFVGSYEITAMLNYLRILNNPGQDIPLAAVLKSELGGFTSEELVMIRVFGGDSVCFWDCVNAYAASGPDAELKNKVNGFLDIFGDIRRMNLNRDISKVIAAIYDRTGFDLYCAALPGGDRRAMNLELLEEYAAKYEESSCSGMYSFVRYLEQIIESEQDLEEAVSAEAGNSVRIMSIHKSKGLEFPVVIVGGLGKLLNDRDANAGLIISSDYGIGAKYTDLVSRKRKDTFRRFLLQMRMKNDFIGEELRLLYVAMTRARQKLILIGTPGKQLHRTAAWESEAQSGQQAYSVSYIADARCFLDYIMPAVMRHPDDFVFTDMPAQGSRDAESEAEAADKASEPSDKNAGNEGKNTDPADTDDKRPVLRTRADFESIPDPGDSQLRRLLRFRYPKTDASSVPVKLSVSDLKHAGMEQEGEDAPWVAGAPSKGAARGTIYHLVMQFIPFAKTDADGVRAFLDSMEKSGIIDESEKAMVEPADIAAFLATDTAARMEEADRAGHLRREQPFVLGRRACDIDPVKYAGVTDIIPVQGIIDCLFMENGRYVILDYKTDHVGPDGGEVLVRRYRAQLENYAEAAERITGVPVSEKIIYSFALGRTISL